MLFLSYYVGGRLRIPERAIDCSQNGFFFEGFEKNIVAALLHDFTPQRIVRHWRHQQDAWRSLGEFVYRLPPIVTRQISIAQDDSKVPAANFLRTLSYRQFPMRPPQGRVAQRKAVFFRTEGREY